MNFQEAKIYRLDCLTTGEVYIGSTCQKLSRRISQHKCGYNYWKRTNKKFMTSCPIIERANYKFTLIELYPCESKHELNLREGFYIRSINCVNKNIAGRTRQEQAYDYYYGNREMILKKSKDLRNQDFL